MSTQRRDALPVRRSLLVRRSRLVRPLLPGGPVLLVLPLLLALVAGCASMPTGGPVRQGRELGLDRDNQLQNLAFAPAKGASQESVVRGFLRAMGVFLDDHAVARQYLTQQASQGWQPLSGTSVYDRRPGSFDAEPDGRVTFSATEVARIAEDGGYHRLPPDTVVRRTFRLVRVEGEWRIADPPKGLVLSKSDVDVAYRSVNLYYLAPTATLVVPDPVMLPNLPGLPTKLVARLLRGPTAELRGAVDTAFPQGTGLEVGSVPVRDGLAVVNLNAAALQADPDVRTSMSAQIVWTLKQVSGIQRIRILADGDDLVTTGVAREQPVTAWRGYDPDAVVSATAYCIVRDGRMQLVEGRTVTAPKGAAGQAGADLRLPALSLDSRQVAAVNADRTRLVTTTVAGPSTLTTSAPLGLLTAPSWDRGGDLWVVDAAAGRLLLQQEAGAPVQAVSVPPLPAGVLTAARVSRDGTRIALVAGTGPAARLYVGGIVRGASGAVDRIAGVVEPRPDVVGVRSVSWADAAALVVLGQLADAPPAPLLVDVDGLAVDDGVIPQQGLVTVTVAPGRPLVAATAAGQVQQWDPSGVGWQSVTRGRDPAYPG